MTSFSRPNSVTGTSLVQRPSAAVASASTISMADIVAGLRRWWWQCALCGTFLAVGAAALTLGTFKPVFLAKGVVEIKADPDFIAFPTHDDGRSYSQTQLEMLRGPIVLSLVAANPEVRRKCEVSADEVADWLADGIKVGFIGRSELCQVTFEAHDSETAALVVNTVIDEYLSTHQDKELANTQRTIDLLNAHQRERHQEVESIRARVRALAKKATGHEPLSASGTSVVLRQNPLDEVERSRVAAEVAYVVLEANVQATEERAAAAAKEEMPNDLLYKALETHPDIAALRYELGVLDKDRAQSESVSKSGAKDPIVLRKTEQMKEATQKIAQHIELLRPEAEAQWRRSQSAGLAQAAADLKSDLAAKKLIVDQWTARVKAKRDELELQSDHALDLQFAQEDLARSQEVHSKIAERIIALTTEKNRPSRSEQRFKAQPPVLPLESVPFKLLLPACFGGFCFPFGLALLWERWARKVTDSHRLSAEFELPVLAEIATLPTRRLTQGFRSNGFLRERVTFEESVDSLRVGLTLSPGGRETRVLLVTSAVSGEGKTNLASSLAVSLARATHEPLLVIDADMRDPDLHEIFGASLEPGLVEVLGEACSPDEAIVSTDITNIDFLPAGRLTVSPHFLLRSGAFESLLAELKGKYRHIIVDSPPVLTASEAVVLAHACDAVLICTRCDYSRSPQLRTAAQRLLAAGAHVLGAVISGVPTRTWAQRYGGYGYGWEKYAAAANGQPRSDADLTARALPGLVPDVSSGTFEN
jgi:polysaccharide biosynthesis transport protein